MKEQYIMLSFTQIVKTKNQSAGGQMCELNACGYLFCSVYTASLKLNQLQLHEGKIST